MNLETYLLFVGACILLCIVPGPDMVYLLSRSIAQGKKAGICAAIGINLGGYFHLLAAILGISTILATSAIAFTILKWCGALYLMYIGVQALWSKGGMINLSDKKSKAASMKAIFWQGFISDVLNPKVAIFFISLLPLFVDTSSANTLSQLLILGVTVNVIAILINILLVVFADLVTKRLRSSARLSSYLNRMMGAIFVGLGIRLVNQQHV